MYTFEAGRIRTPVYRIFLVTFPLEISLYIYIYIVSKCDDCLQSVCVRARFLRTVDYWFVRRRPTGNWLTRDPQSRSSAQLGLTRKLDDDDRPFFCLFFFLAFFRGVNTRGREDLFFDGTQQRRKKNSYSGLRESHSMEETKEEEFFFCVVNKL